MLRQSITTAITGLLIAGFLAAAPTAVAEGPLPAADNCPNPVLGEPVQLQATADVVPFANGGTWPVGDDGGDCSYEHAVAHKLIASSCTNGICWYELYAVAYDISA